MTAVAVVASMGVGFFLGEELYKNVFDKECKDFKSGDDLREYVKNNPEKTIKLDRDRDNILCEGTSVETFILDTR